MGSSHEGSRTSQRNRGSLPIFSLYPSVVTKDSKAQHVLGLSRAQLHDARNESLTLKVQPRPVSSYSSPKKLSPHNLFARRKSRVATAFIEDDVHRPRTTEQRTSSDRDSDLASQSPAASLRRFPSSSTLRSFYDVAIAPLRISQQTSNLSSHDFVLQQLESDVNLFLDDDMESIKPSRFSQIPRLHSITEDKKLDRDDYQVKSTTVLSPISRDSSVDESTTKIPVMAKASSFSPPPTPGSPPTYQSRDSYFKLNQPNSVKAQPERTTNAKIANQSLPTPYAKIHVRRPKAGTKHWFDDVEDISSEEDIVVNSEKQARFSESRKSFRKGHIAYQSLDMDDKEIRSVLSSERKNTDSVFELSAADVVPPSELEGSPIVYKQDPRKRPSASQIRSNPLASANLNHVSILHLSDSEDESEKEDIAKRTIPRKPVPSNSALSIHKTASVEMHDGSNAKVHPAHETKTVSRPPVRTPHPVQSVNKSVPDDRLFKNQYTRAASASERADSESVLDNESEVDALISSFPATPTDTRRPRRVSSHSSIGSSDEKSVASLRIMKVTRQEENLIAAMREKKAAMKRAEKVAANAEALKKSDSDEKAALTVASPDLDDRVKSTVSSIIRLYTDEAEVTNGTPTTSHVATSNEYVPTRDVSPLRQLSGRELQESPVIFSTQHRPEKSHLLKVVEQKSKSARPDSYLSTASGVSQQSTTTTGDLIVLDNLDAAATTSSLHTFPSQLFIESPFEVWKRIDSASLD